MSNSNNNNDETTDCPICLCPIPSDPWGVVAPCGHPYHRECWDQVAANHAASNRGGRAPCSVCKTKAKGFVPVFLDLGNGWGNDGNGECVKSGGRDKNDVMNVDGDEHCDELEKLVDEWDELWKELEELCGHGSGEHSGSGDGNESGDGSVIDMTDRRSDQLVADICATIDLTQPSPQRRRIQSPTQLPSEQSLEVVQGMQQLEEKQNAIRQILQRLKCLHKKIVSTAQQSAQLSSSSPSNNKNNKQQQHLKSKIMTLKSNNAALSSQTISLQSTNEQLSLQLEGLKQTVSDRTVESERSKMQHEDLKSEFKSMEESYQRYMSKSSTEKSTLQTKLTKLQKEYAKLSDQVGLDEIHEMDEIRVKYSRMAQDVHDMKAKNTRLENEWGRKEREWELRCGKEKQTCERLKSQVKRLTEGDGMARDKSFDSAGNDSYECGFARDGKAAGSFSGFGGRKTSAENSDNAARHPMGNEAVGSASASRAFSAARTHQKAPSMKQIIDNAQQRSGMRDDGSANHAAVATKKTNVNGQQRSSAKDQGNAICETAGRRFQTSSSSSGSTGNISQKRRSNKAMDALNSASSRAFPKQLKRPHQSLDQILSHRREIEQRQSSQPESNSPAADGEARGSDDGVDGVQLMMRTGKHHSSKKKRRHGSSSGIGNSQNDHEQNSGRKNSGSVQHCKENNRESSKKRPVSAATVSSESRAPKTSRKPTTIASYSPRQKGNIASFFKPP